MLLTGRTDTPFQLLKEGGVIFPERLRKSRTVQELTLHPAAQGPTFQQDKLSIKGRIANAVGFWATRSVCLGLPQRQLSWHRNHEHEFC